ncbi:hypothetical protein D3C85_1527700 [compost metagenome]
MRRRQYQVNALSHRAAGLLKQEFTQIITLRFQILHLVEHGLTRNVQDTAGNHIIALTSHVSTDNIDHSLEFHKSLF